MPTDRKPIPRITTKANQQEPIRNQVSPVIVDSFIADDDSDSNQLSTESLNIIAHSLRHSINGDHPDTFIEVNSPTQSYESNKTSTTTISTNGGNPETDLLEVDETHFAMTDECKMQGKSKLGNGGSADFTVLDAPVVEHSGEILLIQSDYQGKPKSNAFSSTTDSDVEVLMSEEVMGSDWSGEAVSINKPKNGSRGSVGQEEDTHIESVEVVMTNNTNNTEVSSSSLIRRQESNNSTEPDISADEFSFNSNKKFHDLDRDQLLNVAREQANLLTQFEATLQRYRKAHKALIKHVDILRLEFDDEPEMAKDKQK